MFTGTTTLRARGPARPELAWHRYADLTEWPRWSPQIRRVDAVADRLVPGLTGVVHGPVGVRVHFTVLEVDDAAMRWAWRVRPGAGPVPDRFTDAIGMRLEHGVLADPDGGSSTVLRVIGPLPVRWGYAPIALPALRNLVAD